MNLEELVRHYDEELFRLQSELEEEVKKHKKKSGKLSWINRSNVIAASTGIATGTIFAAPGYHSKFYPATDIPSSEIGYMTGLGEFLLMRLALFARNENIDYKKSIAVPYKRNLFEILLDSPLFPILGAGAVGYVQFTRNTGGNALEGNFIHYAEPGYRAISALETFGAFLAAYSITQLTSRYLNSSQIRKYAYEGKASLDARIGRRDLTIGSLENILSLPLTASQHAAVHYKIAGHYLKLNDIADALAEFSAGLRIAKPEEAFEYAFERRERLSKIVENSNIGELIKQGVVYYSKGLSLEADACFIKALSLNPENAFLHWIRAEALENSERHDEAGYERSTFLDLIFSDPDLESKFTLQHDSRNEIAFYRDERFPAFSIVLKRSKDKESVDLEYRTTKHFAEALKGTVIKPFGEIRQHGDYYYMVMPHAGSRFYEEVMRGNYRLGELKAGIDFLVDYFVAARDADNKGLIKVDDVIQDKDYRTIDGRIIPNSNSEGTLYFSNRIMNIALGYLGNIAGDVQEAFKAGSQVFNRRLESLETVVSKDANIKNFYRTASGVLIAGDFESLKFVPVHTEISRFLEFGLEFLTENEKRGLLEDFYKKWINKNENRKPSRDEFNGFLQDYEFAALYDNLILVGYRARDASGTENLEERLQHYREQLFQLGSAKKHIRNIFNFKDKNIADEEKYALGRLNEGIDGLIKHIEEEHKAKALSARPMQMGLFSKLALMTGAAAIVLGSIGYGLFGKELFSKEYQRNTVAVSASVLYPKQEETMHIIDTRTGEEIYSYPSFSSSFHFNPNKAQITVTANDEEGNYKAFVHDLNSGKESSINYSKYSDNPLWAPDGKYMLLVDGHDSLVVYDTNGRRIPIKGFYPEWAQNSKLLAYVSAENGKLEIADLEGSRIKVRYNSPQIFSEPYPEIEFSPDSERIAYVIKKGTNTLYVADVNFRSIEKILESEDDISDLRWDPNRDVLYFDNNGICQYANEKITQLFPGRVFGIDVSRREQMLINTQEGDYDKLVLLDLKNDSREVVRELKNGVITDFIFTPDGKSAFYVVETDQDISAYIYNFANRENRLVLDLCPDKIASQCIVEQIK